MGFTVTCDECRDTTHDAFQLPDSTRCDECWKEMCEACRKYECPLCTADVCADCDGSHKESHIEEDEESKDEEE